LNIELPGGIQTSMLLSIGELALGLVTLAAFLAIIEISFRFGRRRAAKAEIPLRSHIGALQGALLGLLALLLGFAFAMAVSRFDNRKALVLEESNAIGTTYLRAQLLPQPQRQELKKLLRAYVEARLDFYDAGIDRARFDAANAAAARLSEQLWTVAIALAEKDPRSVPAGLFVQSLNDVIDLSEKRLQALENHVPETVLHLLFGVAAVALGFIGYGCGLDGQRRSVSTTLVSLLIALVLVVIVDIDRPRRGLIKVSQDSMVRLKATIEQTGR
jgi:hypothetical protein